MKVKNCDHVFQKRGNKMFKLRTEEIIYFSNYTYMSSYNDEN